jgi:16S rRNA (uracil1498-N3)-methyltransferase
MPVERFFSEEELVSGQCLFTEAELQHLRVTRARPGSVVEVINGRGRLAKVEIENIDRRTAKGRILESFFQPRPSDERELLQAIPRLNRLDTIIEKATELGASHITLFPGERSEKKSLSAQQKWRLEHLARAAIKQCGRLWLPKISTIASITSWNQSPGLCLFGELDPQAPPLATLLSTEVQPAPQVRFVVGPESGLSPKEDQALRLLNYQGVRLHGNVLRTDTAALIALSVITHGWIPN